ncbi:hypothetical protein [Microbacterium sp. SA39]|uniref:hypothetical protein n=1 Tax=Microbacterium sp. SA39 TaxID=1263625 RepID=UPI00061EF914|nr:hypothetical protein [Microbacterium sp. SA39]KJQ54141.1 hypothetical protein RS85_02212 [Microbacterium sp. SA39]
MTAVSSVEGSEVSFADIVCADPEWVAAEFAELVAGIASVVTSTAAMPLLGAVPRRAVWHLRPPVGSGWLPSVPERVRAPPA